MMKLAVAPDNEADPPTPAPLDRESLIQRIKEKWPLEVKKNQRGGFDFEGGADATRLLAKLEKLTGTSVPSLGLGLVNQVMGTSTAGPQTIEDHNRTLAAIHEIQPRNGLEGMLAVQMVGIHNLAMEFMKRAFIQGQAPEMVDRNIERANKCSRTFAAQLEALNRLRGGTYQKVVVEHVTVGNGGQAVVGNVDVNRTGG